MAQRINTERVEQIDVTPFVESLMYHGYSQISLIFDWRTGEWEVSWPSASKKAEEEQDEGEPD